MQGTWSTIWQNLLAVCSKWCQWTCPQASHFLTVYAGLVVRSEALFHGVPAHQLPHLQLLLREAMLEVALLLLAVKQHSGSGYANILPLLPIPATHGTAGSKSS